MKVSQWRILWDFLANQLNTTNNSQFLAGFCALATYVGAPMFPLKDCAWNHQNHVRSSWLMVAICCVFNCFHLLMDICDDHRSFSLYLVPPRLQPANHTLWWLWKAFTEGVWCGSITTRACPSTLLPLQNKPPLPDISSPAVFHRHREPVFVSVSNHWIQGGHHFHQRRWFCSKF